MRKINDKSLLNKCVAVFFRDAGDNMVDKIINVKIFFLF